MPACQQHLEIPGGDSEPVDEIIFRTTDPSLSAEVATKATAVTSLSSFNVSAVTGSAGSETAVWTNVSFTGNNDAGYKADKWWPAEDASYRFYASNSALTFAASGATVAATNATDVICAYAAAPSYKAKNTLSFEHIFARLGAVTVSAATGYTISNVSIKITPKTGGTYNLLTGAGHTDGTGWSGLATGSETVIASATGSNANDIYLVPGTYTLTASWTAARGLYTENIQNMQVDVNLTAGKINTISTTLSGNAKEVVFNVNIAPWTEQNQVVEFPTKNNNAFYIQVLEDGSEIYWGRGYYSSGPGLLADARTIKWSTDGDNWTSITNTEYRQGDAVRKGALVGTFNAGDKIYFKGTNTELGGKYNYGGFAGGQFNVTHNFNVGGNIASLLDEDGFDDEANTKICPGPYAFVTLFKCQTFLKSAGELILPYEKLTDYCYAEMFCGCTGLLEAPDLPSIRLAASCYRGMFTDCSSLTKAPDLPALDLASGCYSSMFLRCSSLTSIKVNAYSANNWYATYSSSYGTSGWMNGPSNTPVLGSGGIFYTYHTRQWQSNGSGYEIPVNWSRQYLEEPEQGHDYVDLGLRKAGNKILFATHNTGSGLPENTGDYFSWGERTKHYSGWTNATTIGGTGFIWSNTPYYSSGEGTTTVWSKYTSNKNDLAEGGVADGLTTLDSSDDITCIYWGGSWRMPDRDELAYLCSSSVTREWTNDYDGTGVSGMIVRGKGSFSGAFIFLPAAGYVNNTTRSSNGTIGRYWSRSLNPDMPDAPYFLEFSSSEAVVDAMERYEGHSVRPVLVIPQ